MENKKQSNYTTKKCYCGVSYETYRNTASCCKLCQKEKHRVLAKQYARDNIKLSDGVKKSCVICNKPFTVKTNAVSCSKSCTDIRYLELNRRKMRYYRSRNKNTEKFQSNKKIWDENYKIDIQCILCKKKSRVNPGHISKRFNYKCTKCFQLSTDKIISMCSRRKSKANTSGYIGVHLINKSWKKDEPWGVLALLVHNKMNIFRNKYKDETQNKKTIIQAAVDRDIFIIEKQLPHTRNFTDIELVGEMEYLAHHQLNIIKRRLDLGIVKI